MHLSLKFHRDPLVWICASFSCHYIYSKDETAEKYDFIVNVSYVFKCTHIHIYVIYTYMYIRMYRHTHLKYEEHFTEATVPMCGVQGILVFY
jgi:hypothetical protein